MSNYRKAYLDFNDVGNCRPIFIIPIIDRLYEKNYIYETN